MATVHLPASVLVAGAVAAVLGGYLVGVVAGPDTPAHTNGVVKSFESAGDELCLTGDAAADAEGAKDGVLCGTWQRTASSSTPKPGEEFRFVSRTSQRGGPESATEVLIYGDVVGAS